MDAHAIFGTNSRKYTDRFFACSTKARATGGLWCSGTHRCRRLAGYRSTRSVTMRARVWWQMAGSDRGWRASGQSTSADSDSWLPAKSSESAAAL